MPASEEPVLFTILEGECRLEVGGQPPQWVSKGDVVFLPKGSAYRLGSSADAPDQWVSDMLKQRSIECYTLRQNGGGDVCSFIGGLSTWDDVARSTVAHILPEIIIVKQADFGPQSRIADLTRILEQEARSPREITPLLANDLINMILHEALYTRFTDETLRRALFITFGSPPIAKALMLIHSTIVQDWTVSSLAQRVGMSRSAFTIEFTKLQGISPGQYLMNQKLEHAAHLLEESGLDVGLVADRVGYASMPSFIKAFKRQYGDSPGRFRRRFAEQSQMDSQA